MRPPFFRLPTRDARDADHMAILAFAGGIYFWWGRGELPSATAPWMSAIAIASALCGFLLWLRIPGVKWLGVVVVLSLCGFSIRRIMIEGWNLRFGISLVLGLLSAIWMARIDYSHRFVDDDEV